MPPKNIPSICGVESASWHQKLSSSNTAIRLGVAKQVKGVLTWNLEPVSKGAQTLYALSPFTGFVTFGQPIVFGLYADRARNQPIMFCSQQQTIKGNTDLIFERYENGHLKERFAYYSSGLGSSSDEELMSFFHMEHLPHLSLEQKRSDDVIKTEMWASDVQYQGTSRERSASAATVETYFSRDWDEAGQSRIAGTEETQLYSKITGLLEQYQAAYFKRVVSTLLTTPQPTGSLFQFLFNRPENKHRCYSYEGGFTGKLPRISQNGPGVLTTYEPSGESSDENISGFDELLQLQGLDHEVHGRLCPTAYHAEFSDSMMTTIHLIDEGWCVGEELYHVEPIKVSKYREVEEPRRHRVGEVIHDFLPTIKLQIEIATIPVAMIEINTNELTLAGTLKTNGDQLLSQPLPLIFHTLLTKPDFEPLLKAFIRELPYVVYQASLLPLQPTETNCPRLSAVVRERLKPFFPEHYVWLLGLERGRMEDIPYPFELNQFVHIDGKYFFEFTNYLLARCERLGLKNSVFSGQVSSLVSAYLKSSSLLKQADHLRVFSEVIHQVRVILFLYEEAKHLYPEQAEWLRDCARQVNMILEADASVPVAMQPAQEHLTQAVSEASTSQAPVLVDASLAAARAASSVSRRERKQQNRTSVGPEHRYLQRKEEFLEDASQRCSEQYFYLLSQSAEALGSLKTRFEREKNDKILAAEERRKMLLAEAARLAAIARLADTHPVPPQKLSPESAQLSKVTKTTARPSQQHSEPVRPAVNAWQHPLFLSKERYPSLPATTAAAASQAVPGVRETSRSCFFEQPLPQPALAAMSDRAPTEIPVAPHPSGFFEEVRIRQNNPYDFDCLTGQKRGQLST